MFLINVLAYLSQNIIGGLEGEQWGTQLDGMSLNEFGVGVDDMAKCHISGFFFFFYSCSDVNHLTSKSILALNTARVSS